MNEKLNVFMVVALRLTAAILAIIVAGLLAYNDKLGWGWFLFIAFLLGSITLKSS